MSKIIGIEDRLYDDLVKAKKMAEEKARKVGNIELLDTLKEMDLGSYAGWLIYQGVKKIYDEYDNDKKMKKK